MNRDERRTRSEGLPPEHWQDTDILAPRDPDAGGTWIGVRRDGTWACLLNGYLSGVAQHDIKEPQTRGRLIPAVLASTKPQQELGAMDLSRTNAFRLWLGTNDGITDFFWDGKTLSQQQPVVCDNYTFVTSSSVQQDAVKELRADVFSSWVLAGAQHQKNGLPTLLTDAAGLGPSDAIAMGREHSHTKSCTQITTGNGESHMQHWGFDRRHMPAEVSVSF
ncbi:MAG: NRDE family protein [Parvularculaceae bacterium]|nr:NRDE family protein [Parvularculaceae bacterium]